MCSNYRIGWSMEWKDKGKRCEVAYVAPPIVCSGIKKDNPIVYSGIKKDAPKLDSGIKLISGN